jgi:hypothetical protein
MTEDVLLKYKGSFNLTFSISDFTYIIPRYIVGIEQFLVAQLVRKFSAFMEHGNSSLCSQKFTTTSYPDAVKSSQHFYNIFIYYTSSIYVWISQEISFVEVFVRCPLWSANLIFPLIFHRVSGIQYKREALC